MRERLVRSRTDRVIGGLAAGLARNLGVDPTWVRLGWVVLAFVTDGIAVLLYLALLFVVPEEPEAPEGVETPGADGAGAGDAAFAGARPAGDRPPAARAEPGSGSRNAALVAGLVLVAAGAWLLARRLIAIDWELTWPVIAIAVGVALVVAALRSGRDST